MVSLRKTTRATGRELQEALQQLELPLEGATSFFYFYSSIIEDGHLARMGPEAIAVLSVMRYRCDWNTSRVAIGLRQISTLTGMSTRRISKAIEKLEEQGYLEKVFFEDRKRPIYLLLDKILLRDANGKEVMKLDLEYKPSQLRNQLTKLKNLKEGGSTVPTQQEGMHTYLIAVDNSVHNQQTITINIGNDAINLNNTEVIQGHNRKNLEALARMLQTAIERGGAK